MAFIGPYQQYALDGSATVARVEDWTKQATAINAGLAQAESNAGATAKGYTDAQVAPVAAMQPMKCVRLENGKWVWDTTNGTHFVLRDWAGGSLVVRPTAQPVPDTTPALNW